MILGSIALGNWDPMFNTGTYSVLFIIIIITIMILSNPAMRMAFLHRKFSLFGIKTSSSKSETSTRSGVVTSDILIDHPPSPLNSESEFESASLTQLGSFWLVGLSMKAFLKNGFLKI